MLHKCASVFASIYFLQKSLFSFYAAAAAAAKSLQSCPTLCDPIDSSPPGSPIPGILQARTLEWVAISFSMLLFLMHITHLYFYSAFYPKKNQNALVFRKIHDFIYNMILTSEQ